MSTKYFGNRLRLYRKSKRLNVKEFSKILGISHGSLSCLETNKTKPSSDTLQALYLYTDISFDWLFTGEEPMVKKKQKDHTIEDTVGHKEKIKKWLDCYWDKANREERVWLFVEIKKRFPEFVDWLNKEEKIDKKKE